MNKSLLLSLVLVSSFSTVGCLSSGSKAPDMEEQSAAGEAGGDVVPEKAVTDQAAAVNAEMESLNPQEQEEDLPAVILPASVEDPQGSAGFQSATAQQKQDGRTPASTPGAHAVR